MRKLACIAILLVALPILFYAMPVQASDYPLPPTGLEVRETIDSVYVNPDGSMTVSGYIYIKNEDNQNTAYIALIRDIMQVKVNGGVWIWANEVIVLNNVEQIAPSTTGVYPFTITFGYYAGYTAYRSTVIVGLYNHPNEWYHDFVYRTSFDAP